MNGIENLLAAMTVEEKIGQLNMVAAGYAVTRPVLASGAAKGIRAGRIGSLLNLWGTREVHAMQKIAIKKPSRAGGCFSYRSRLGLSANSRPYI